MSLSDHSRAALAPTAFINSDHPDIIAFAQNYRVPGDPSATASALAQAVRDAVPYSLWSFQIEPAGFVASQVLQAPTAYCIPKAVLLAAVARAAGIPARLGFADVRNHLTSPRFAALMDSPDFHWHAYTALEIDGRWLKATPAFDAGLCARNGVEPLVFDGHHDSVFQPFDSAGRRSMEYIRFHGEFDDLPYDLLSTEMGRLYPGLLRAVSAERDRRAADLDQNRKTP